MKLSIGIVGLPNVGKSTLFKLITKQEVNIANYPFATIDPNVGVAAVPDERLERLAEMSKSSKKIPAAVEFYDIAGLVKGANKGEGLGNQFLANIRETQAIAHTVRCFRDDGVHHVEGEPSPERDMEIINTELVYKDLETVEKRVGSLEREAKTGDKAKRVELDRLMKVRDELLKGEMVFGLSEELIECLAVKELNLLTAKSQVFILNGKEEEVSQELKNKIREKGFDYVVVDLALAEGVEKIIKKSYEILGLISFFTTGSDETRAWTIKRGTKAPQAAGVIHTDFEKKFIRMEAILAEDLLDLGGWVKAKQTGKLRLEGKEYEMRDGDVVEVRHG